jgi:hypothetical protein
MEIDKNLKINLVFCLSKRLLFFDLLPSLSTYIFQVKIKLFVTLKGLSHEIAFKNVDQTLKNLT